MMNNNPYVPAALSLALLAACASGPARDYTALYGDPAPPSAATRTIVIRPDTRYVNVEGGQTVRFQVGDKQFGWLFNTARTVNSFDLAEVAPSGTLNHSVIAYVSPNPLYWSVPLR